MYPGHATISTTPSPLPIFSILDRAGEAHSATTASAVSRKLPDRRSLRHDITSPYCGFPAGKHPSYPRRRPIAVQPRGTLRSVSVRSDTRRRKRGCVLGQGRRFDVTEQAKIEVGAAHL